MRIATYGGCRLVSHRTRRRNWVGGAAFRLGARREVSGRNKKRYSMIASRSYAAVDPLPGFTAESLGYARFSICETHESGCYFLPTLSRAFECWPTKRKHGYTTDMFVSHSEPVLKE